MSFLSVRPYNVSINLIAELPSDEPEHEAPCAWEAHQV